MHIFYKMKSDLTVFFAVVILILCLATCCLPSMAAAARPPRNHPGTVLIVPARQDVIRLTHEISKIRAITMVAFRGRPGHSALNIYCWNGKVWQPVAMDDFLTLKFIASQPDRIVIIGGDDIVPFRLSRLKSTMLEIKRIRSIQPEDILCGLDAFMFFTPQEMNDLNRLTGLSYCCSDPPVPVEERPPQKQSDRITSLAFKKDTASLETRSMTVPPSQGVVEQKPEGQRPLPKVSMVETNTVIMQKSPIGSVADRNELRLDLGDGVKMVFIRLPELGLWVGRDEVTNDQYKRFDRSHDPKKYYDHAVNLPDQPAVMVSWEDAVNYCAWLNRNLYGQIPPGHECRLPTESEWIAFARCGLDKEYPWGQAWPPPSTYNYKGMEGANLLYKIFHNEKFLDGHDDGFIVAAPVAKSGVNEWGLRGVGGNVWEWCQDLYEENRFERVLKGAAWNNSERAFLTITNRSAALPDKRNAMIGFRVVIAPRIK